jgi:hypothetical protein
MHVSDRIPSMHDPDPPPPTRRRRRQAPNPLPPTGASLLAAPPAVPCANCAAHSHPSDPASARAQARSVESPSHLTPTRRGPCPLSSPPFPPRRRVAGHHALTAHRRSTHKHMVCVRA